MGNTQKLQKSDLNEEIMFHYDNTTEYNNPSSSIKEFKVIKIYDCVDYIEVKLDGSDSNGTTMKVKDLISIFFNDITKDIKFKYKSKEVVIKDIKVMNSPITPIGIIVLLENKYK